MSAMIDTPLSASNQKFGNPAGAAAANIPYAKIIVY
jgi:hypothetical protein